MGGHGGLNILPQKRWNVYNRDNRLKVAQDEAKAKQHEDEARERHEQAEREHRHRLLLRRGSVDNADEKESNDGFEAPAAPLEHINFWKDEEIKLQHPENEKQKRDELKQRGNPDFFTTDAKFDERFALAYGITGEKPWYARAHKPDALADAGAGGGLLPGGAIAAGRGALGTCAAVTGGQSCSSRNEQLLPGTKQQQPKELCLARRRKRSKPSRSSNSRDLSSASKTTSSSTSSASSSASDTSSSGTSSCSDSSSSDVSDSDDISRKKKARRRSSRSLSTGNRSRSDTRRGRHKKRRRRSPSPSSASDDGSDRSGGHGSRQLKHRRKLGSKSRSRSKRSSGHRLPPLAAPASKSIEQLRAERMEREKQERIKQRGMLAGTAVLPDGAPEKGYNSAFGFAAALKRRRTQ